MPEKQTHPRAIGTGGGNGRLYRENREKSTTRGEENRGDFGSEMESHVFANGELSEAPG